MISWQLFTSEKSVRNLGKIFVRLELNSVAISSSLIQNNFIKLSHVSLDYCSVNEIQFGFKCLCDVCSVHGRLHNQISLSSCEKGLCSQQDSS